MKPDPISAAILAGGKNTRFGGLNKARVVVEGSMIIERMLSEIESLFREIIIVTNSPEEFAEYRRVIVTGDIFPGKGPAGGLHAALKTAGNDRVFLFACDMPFINESIIHEIAEYSLRCEAGAVVPEHCGKYEPLHAVYHKNTLPLLEKMLRSDSGFSMMELLGKINTKYYTLPDSDKLKKAFLNINSPDDVHAL